MLYYVSSYRIREYYTAHCSVSELMYSRELKGDTLRHLILDRAAAGGFSFDQYLPVVTEW